MSWKAIMRSLADRAFAVLGGFAALMLLALMGLTCADVVGRYFLNLPLRGAYELTGMLLALVIFGAMPLATASDDHIVIDAFEAIVPVRLGRLQRLISGLIGMIATGYLSWQLWRLAESLDASGEVTAQLKLKPAYLVYGMSLLMLFTSVAMLSLAIWRNNRRSKSVE
jgi:TRAP-type C4-dicarboxylate transport system permease small subunit